jgi:hypothetical protein
MRRILLVLAVAACASRPHRRERTQLTGCMTGPEGVICDGYRFAQVLCINPSRRPRATDPPPSPDGSDDSSSKSCRALGVRYFDDDEVVWLYRARGFDPNHPERTYRDAKVDTRRAFAAQLSPDGMKLRYETHSFSWFGYRKHLHEYDLFSGTVRDD